MTIKTIGLDIAKQVFQIHAVDERGQVVMKKQLARANWLLSLPTFEPTEMSRRWTKSVLAYRYKVQAPTIGPA